MLGPRLPQQLPAIKERRHETEVVACSTIVLRTSPGAPTPRHENARETYVIRQHKFT